MSTNYTTYQQHEPLRAPSGWSANEKRFVAQLEELFDDIYKRYNRLRLEDMSPGFRKAFKQIQDDGTEMRADISATAAGLRAEISRATLAEETLSNSISVTAEGLTTEITRATTAEGNLSNSIDVTAHGLSAEITRATTAEGSLSTSISTTADGLAAEITRATTAEGSLSTLISTTAQGIRTEVSRDYLSKSSAAETYATKSEIVQDDTSWKATFGKIGASGYTASGITTITENGITVRHSSLSNCYTEMSASGFRILNSGGTVLGGVMTLNGKVVTAMGTLYNASYPAFVMDVGTYTPFDTEGTSSGYGLSLKNNGTEFMHLGRNVYSSGYAQYNEIYSANGLFITTEGQLFIYQKSGPSISFTSNDIIFAFRANNRTLTVKVSDLYDLFNP